MVVINPGQSTAEEYISIVNSTVTFENSFDRYVNHWEALSYADNYPSHKFVHMIYGAETESQMLEVARLSRERNAGYVFITDDVLPNPYDTFPLYMGQEVDALKTCQYNLTHTGSGSNSRALSDGAIIGIVIGGVAFVCVILSIIHYITSNSKKNIDGRGGMDMVSQTADIAEA